MTPAIFRTTLAAAGLLAAPAAAEEPRLVPPIDCDLTRSCYIQQYMDRNPGPGTEDFTCASLSYDGHKGTDFALRSLAQMREGVTVTAAAPGTVKALRDGMEDEGFTAETADRIGGRECGNGVVIDHGDGWETQYCHLRKDSLTVEKGQQVTTGTPLGLVGQSGRAAFPHVHLSVRHDGAEVDPFDPDGVLTCDTPGDSSLWADPPPYRAGGLIDVGFADHIPAYAAIKDGTARSDALTSQAPALVIYGFTFGTQAGDVLRLSITGPHGAVITDDVTLERSQAQAFRAIGKKRRSAPWPGGSYEGTVELIRKGKAIDRMTTRITLN